jgi:exodeoxyribonuclease-3
VNSIGARTERVLNWCEKHQPDLVGIQELKCTNDAFPREQFEALGYTSHTHGTGRWNGVAFLTKSEISDVTRDLPNQPLFENGIEPRAIACTFGDVRIWNLYVPNGREPGHDHFVYKLDWLLALRNTLQDEMKSYKQVVVMGDFNIAPTDDDVWDIKDFENATHVTKEERGALAQILNLGFEDLMPRSLKGKPFTFWDYRALMFQKAMGMRIDLVLTTHDFKTRIKDLWIDRDERKLKGGSDHAPVVVDFV